MVKKKKTTKANRKDCTNCRGYHLFVFLLRVKVDCTHLIRQGCDCKNVFESKSNQYERYLHTENDNRMHFTCCSFFYIHILIHTTLIYITSYYGISYTIRLI